MDQDDIRAAQLREYIKQAIQQMHESVRGLTLLPSVFFEVKNTSEKGFRTSTPPSSVTLSMAGWRIFIYQPHHQTVFARVFTP
jgi:hypothetical protein